MKATKIDDDIRENILAQNRDLFNPLHIDIERQETEKARAIVPDCYSVDFLGELLDRCTGDDECCRFSDNDEGQLNLLTNASRDLQTIHRVTESVKDHLKDQLTEQQMLRLNNADYVILNDNNLLKWPPMLSLHLR